MTLQIHPSRQVLRMLPRYLAFRKSRAVVSEFHTDVAAEFSLDDIRPKVLLHWTPSHKARTSKKREPRNLRPPDLAYDKNTK